MKKYTLFKSFIKAEDEVTPGRFDLNKFVEKWLGTLHVATYNSCCDEGKTKLPVRYDATTEKIQIFNETDWVALPIATPTAAAINATATATTDQVLSGLITSTSAAATNITLPTATALATALGAVKGSSFEFVVDNTAGASLVTLVVGAGITAGSAVTGGTTLTVAASATTGIGVFRLTFISTTAAMLSRIA